MYWVTTNTITLLQHYLLNMPQVKSYFNLPDLKKLPKNVNNSDNFLESFRESKFIMKLLFHINKFIENNFVTIIIDLNLIFFRYIKY